MGQFTYQTFNFLSFHIDIIKLPRSPCRRRQPADRYLADRIPSADRYLADKSYPTYRYLVDINRPKKYKVTKSFFNLSDYNEGIKIKGCGGGRSVHINVNRLQTQKTPGE